MHPWWGPALVFEKGTLVHDWGRVIDNSGSIHDVTGIIM